MVQTIRAQKITMKTKTSLKKPKIRDDKKRVLISVSVLGSAGPLRLLVNDDEAVGCVIDAALKLYAREGRIPVLGSDPARFFLYCHDGAVLGALDTIGSSGARSFVLAPVKPTRPAPGPDNGGTGASWKAWLHRSLTFNVLSH